VYVEEVCIQIGTSQQGCGAVMLFCQEICGWMGRSGDDTVPAVRTRVGTSLLMTGRAQHQARVIGAGPGPGDWTSTLPPAWPERHLRPCGSTLSWTGPMPA
jgi:hypothetical protein